MAKPTLSPAAKCELAEIARVHLGIETLEVRKRDSLELHSLAVRSIKAALEAAYLAGMVDHYRKRE